MVRIVMLMLFPLHAYAATDFGPSVRDIHQAVDAYVDGIRPKGFMQKQNLAGDLVTAVVRLRARSSGPNVEDLLWAFGRLTAHTLGRSAAAAARDRHAWLSTDAPDAPDLYHPDLRMLLARAGNGRTAALAVLEDMSRTNLDDDVRVRAAEALEVIYGALFVIALGDGTPEDRVLPHVNRIRARAIAILADGNHQATSFVRHLLRIHEGGTDASPIIKAAATRGILKLVWQKHPDEVAQACIRILDEAPRNAAVSR